MDGHLQSAFFLQFLYPESYSICDAKVILQLLKGVYKGELLNIILWKLDNKKSDLRWKSQRIKTHLPASGFSKDFSNLVYQMSTQLPKVYDFCPKIFVTSTSVERTHIKIIMCGICIHAGFIYSKY